MQAQLRFAKVVRYHSQTLKISFHRGVPQAWNKWVDSCFQIAYLQRSGIKFLIFLKSMNVLFVSPEVNPLVRTGGLGDVVGSLPLSLKKLGIDVRVICPLHRECKEIDSHVLDPKIIVKLNDQSMDASIRLAKLGDENIPAYLIDLPHFFDRAGIYSDENGDFQDNAQRAFALCQAALELEKIIGWRPYIIHAHDWMAAPVCGYLNALQVELPEASKIRSVLTIHNLQHQGVF